MPKLMQPVNPPSLPKPAGYAHGWEVQGGKTIYIAGQVALNQEGHVVGKGDLAAQFRQVCENLKAVVTARAGQMNDIVKLTIYVLSKTEYKAHGRDIGVLAAGRQADLIAVKGNPLDDIRLLESVAFVMKGGTVVKEQK